MMVVVSPAVKLEVRKVVKNIKKKAQLIGSEDLDNFGRTLTSLYNNTILRLHSEEVGQYPLSYPLLGDAGYKSVVLLEYWSLFYLKHNHAIYIVLFWDNRGNPENITNQLELGVPGIEDLDI